MKEKKQRVSSSRERAREEERNERSTDCVESDCFLSKRDIVTWCREDSLSRDVWARRSESEEASCGQQYRRWTKGGQARERGELHRWEAIEN